MKKNTKLTREYYIELFKHYPDVVNTKTFCEMLGGIGIKTAWNLINGKHVKSIYYLDQAFLIPKVWVIDYVTSDHYAEFKKKLKVKI